MKLAILLLSLFVAIAFVSSAMAVMPGKSIEYPDGDQGKVIFSGDTHGVKQGMKCPDCHPKLFQMKKGAFKMTKEDHGKDTGCGTCHNGKKAFSQSDEASCGKCHKKAEAPAIAPEQPATEPEQPAPEPEQPPE
jgi:c(7)-type cytochrome triheme protein